MEPGKAAWIDKLVAYLGMNPKQAGLLKLLALAVVVGVVLLNFGSLVGLGSSSGGPPPQSTPTAAAPGPQQDELVRMEQDLAARLEQMLSLIQGAGRVRVLVTLESGPEITPVTTSKQQETITRERTTEGSTRDTNQVQEDITPVTVKGGSSSDALAVLKRSGPRVAGVLVVAEGATSKSVQAKLHRAAVTALGISADRISVVAAEGR